MTIKDIAKECNCAVGTVSRVLNNHPDVSDKTRKKVMEVVEKYGFIVNANAKQLKVQNRKNIVVIVKGTSSPLLNELLEKLQKKIEPLTYYITVVVLDENDDEVDNAVRIYFSQTPIGFIFLGGSIDENNSEFNKIKVPCVLISNDANLVQSEYLSSVSIDNKNAAYFITQHLIKNGHTKIGVIGGEIKESDVSKNRYEGFLQAMNEAGLPFDYNKSYKSSKYSFHGGFEAAENLLKENPEITAIFNMSDVMAIGACRKLSDKGIKVPQEISITGFDGIDIGSYFNPRLTTIRQVEDELVDEGLSILLDNLENEIKAVHKRVQYEFIQGESVKKIN